MIPTEITHNHYVIEKKSSFEYGKAGSRHKIYYSSVVELNAQIDELKSAGLWLDYNTRGE